MPRAKLILPSTFQFATEFRVRVSDVNYAGHLSNDRVLALIHEARVRFLNQFGFTELNVDGVGTIQTDAVIIYKSEAFHGDVLKIEVAAGAFHKFGCDFYYRISNAHSNKEIARAKTGMVFFDYNERKMVPVPNRFLEICAPKSSRKDA
jgi:acyl-CoA thioesterase FadM